MDIIKKYIFYKTRIINAIRYILRGDFKGLTQRLSFHKKEKLRFKHYSRVGNRKDETWGILTTPHTLFIANILAERLALHGISSEIMTCPPSSYEHSFYFVLCAQMFENLPPENKRVIFQLEQSVSSRWFTDEYLNILNKSFAVIEYSLTNMDYLFEKGINYPHTLYLPIGTSIAPPTIIEVSDKKFDFIFYGDNLSSPRRQKLLEILQKKFKVKICNNLFGDDMADIIRQSKAVINIHYYDNALLEMPRIQECISLGVPILSESTTDKNEYPELNGAIRFFEQGSEEDMLRQALAIIEDLPAVYKNLMKSAEISARKFTFMFDRCLVTLGILPANEILKKPIYINGKSDTIALSLPETIKRRQIFEKNKPQNCAIFDGIRNVKSWVGCGSSFCALAQYALSNNIENLTVFEDDALFAPDHNQRLKTVKKYLESRTERWDLFSGMIASAHPEMRVQSVEEFEGITFVTIDKMTSMVFNIYNKPALEILSRWDALNENVDQNAIDRYLESHNDLRIIVALPFLVGHREDVFSTLWGFQNDQYALMIVKSEEQITKKAEEWRLLNNSSKVNAISR